jgi:hypothetical protein
MPMRIPTPRALATVAILIAIAVLASGCITRSVRKTFYEDRSTRIVLVQQKRGGDVVERGYAHPMQIAPVRMAHILSRLDVRVESKDDIQRMPAIQTNALYEIADHLSRAFSQADSNQYLVVYYRRRNKRLGVFDENFLTSFLVFTEGDTMFLQFSKVEWEIPKGGRREKLPEPKMDDETDAFRVVASKGAIVANPNAFLIDWGNPVFKKPTRTHIAPGGKIVRRTILMEAPEEVEPEDDETVETMPASLSPATLRALADLEEERANGEVTEADYGARRRRILAADPASK